MIYLDLEGLLHVAQRTLGEVRVRDIGLLDSAAARPRSTAFGDDAYPSVHDKAASLLHSLARTQPLVDGNKRLALAATIAFYGLNGIRLSMSNDEAYELVMAVASGHLDDVEPIAERLRSGTGVGLDLAAVVEQDDTNLDDPISAGQQSGGLDVDDGNGHDGSSGVTASRGRRGRAGGGR